MIDFLLSLNGVIVILSLVVAGIGWLLWKTHQEHSYITNKILPRTKNWVFLEIQVPKEGSGEEKKSSKEEKMQMISIAEQLFTSLSETSTMGKYGFKDYFSLEIACTDKKISFYINCPKSIQELVEKQVQAQYPESFIEVSKGYNPFQKGGSIEIAELGLSKKYVYPLRTYKMIESDSLNAITNAMTKLSENEGAVVQYILKPAGTGWQFKPRKMALQIQQGKHQDHLDQGPYLKLFNSVMKGVHKGLMGILGGGGEDKNDQKPNRSDLTGQSSPINLTPQQQEIVKRLEEKASRPGFEVNVRIMASSTSKESARLHVQNILASFLQFNMPPFNGFYVKKLKHKFLLRDFIFRVFRKQSEKFILNTEELASLWHLPTPFLETPNIKWLSAKKAPPPINMPKEGLLLGRSIYRSIETKAFMKTEDRMRHMYILGRSGTGKSNFMEFMAIQDIQNGAGMCIIDPHGEFVEHVLPHIPKSRAEEVILFEPFDLDRPMGLNMLEVFAEEQKDFAVQEMISIFYKLVTDPAMLGPMFEHNMRNAMLTLMSDEENPGTLVEIPRIFTDTDFQNYKVSKLKDPVVRAFWEKEMAKTSDYHKSEMLGYLVSKVGRFVENSMMRNIVGQPKSAFNFREVMDSGKILLVNLSKGRVGELNAKLIGLIIVSKLQMAALSRADTPEKNRRDFFLYVDEFQNFITDAFSSILSEARKYRLGLIIAHQFLSQLEGAAGAAGAGSKDLRDAVFGNAGTMACFRIGVEDAETMAKEFSPTFNQFDLVNIERFNCFVKLLIDNAGSKPFNMATYPLPPVTPEMEKTAAAIRQLSRLKYGRPREEVEAEILEASQVADMMSAGIGSIEDSL